MTAIQVNLRSLLIYIFASFGQLGILNEITRNDIGTNDESSTGLELRRERKHIRVLDIDVEIAELILAVQIGLVELSDERLRRR